MKYKLLKKTILPTVLLSLIITPIMFVNVITANNVTNERAKQIALAYVNDPSATISYVEYESKRNRSAKYEVFGFTNSARFELEIDSSTGNVLDSEIKFNKNFQNNGLNDIGSAKATQIALDYVNDPSARVSHVKADYKKKGVSEYEVDIFTDSAKYEFEINASTGEFISIEAEYFLGNRW